MNPESNAALSMKTPKCPRTVLKIPSPNFNLNFAMTQLQWRLPQLPPASVTAAR